MMHPALNIPNLLTFLRISLIPIFILVFYCTFAIAAFTDWLDGYLARRLKQVSSLGTFLDPVADKLIVAVALVLLVQSHATVYLTIPAVVIVSREIAISALREWMAELGKRKEIAVKSIGRYKTAAQMAAIVLLLFQDPKNVGWITISGYILIDVAAILTLWSMFLYLRAAWKDLSDPDYAQSVPPKKLPME